MTLWTPVTGLNEWADKKPDARFLVQPREGITTEYSWSDVRESAQRFASYLISSGYQPGSRVAVISRNCAESIISDLGIWMAGCVSVQIYPSLNANTLAYILEHCEAQCLLLGLVDDWPLMCGGVPDGLPIIRFPHAPFEKLKQSYLSWQDVLAQSEPLREPVSRGSDDLARLMYTSGSTGKPKGVMVSFAALAAAKDALREVADAGEQDRLISYLPFAHAFESAYVHNASLSLGCEVFFSEGLESFAADLRRARPTIFHSVPRLWVKFQQAVQQQLPDEQLRAALADPASAQTTSQKVLQQLGLQDVRIALSGSAPLAESVIDWYRALGLELLEGYGMTEDFAYSHITRSGQVRVGYVGSPLAGVQSRIADNGEVQIKSPAQMSGYYRNEEATAAAFSKDGWFKTGDLGEFDEQGRLRLSGRLKEIFKTSKGKYVAPAPIENALGHPLIENLCVVGEGQPKPCVLMVPSQAAIEALGEAFDKAAFEAELRSMIEAANSQLDPHEQLGYGVLVEQPWSIANNLLTPTLKLKRNEIEARYVAHLDDWTQRRAAIIWQQT